MKRISTFLALCLIACPAIAEELQKSRITQPMIDVQTSSIPLPSELNEIYIAQAVAVPDNGAYLCELQRRIRRNWHPTQEQEDKRVVVSFTIDRQGRLMGLSIGRSSGNPDADATAMAAVRLAAPFRALPAGYKDNELALQYTFDYINYRGIMGGVNYH